VPPNLIIVGDSAFAEIAFEYFTHDSEYDVVGFSVERDFLHRDELAGLPVVPFDELDKIYAPSNHSVYVAATYTELNRLRTRLANSAKAMGFRLASYVSSKAFVWCNVELGEHCFVFEGNVVQPFVRVGRNVVLWSGNHIGHHSVIGDNSFVSSQVVVSGFVETGENCFLGVNSTIANNVRIGADAWIGPAVVVTKDVGEASFLKPAPSERGARSTLEFFGIEA
jgi:sugar O-acyltransferase (sialic acid O-acetyltransferase NeuD family)